jgi:hypothetical protein
VVNLREQLEADLEHALENPNGFGLPAILIDPDGEEHGPYYGQILYDTRDIDDMGNMIIVHEPVVTLRLSSLARVPLAAEKNKWAVKIPTTPSLTAPKETFILSRPSEDGRSLGFIRLYLTKTVQS